ncbi:hypothetical protein GCM10027020_38720 [Nocardioides salsibiostraticola]
MNDEQPKDWECAMSNEFDRRVRDLNEAPLSFEAIKGKATSIRRKRRAAVAGSVLAVAAVIAPVAVLALNDDQQSRTIQPADPTPTVVTDPTPSPTPTPEPAPSPANRLGIDYLEGRTLVRADGTIMDLPNDYQDGTRVGDDMFLGVAYSEEGIVIEEVDENGTFVGLEPALSTVTSNDDRTVAAYLNQDGSVELRSATDRATIPALFQDGATPVTVVGDADCIATESCLVFVNPAGEEPPSVVSQIGSVEPFTNGIVAINDSETPSGPTVGVVSVQNEGTCNSAFGGARGEALFENCEFRYFDFSPDQRFLSGAQSYGDGFGDAWAGIYDATDGSEIARLQSDNQAVVQSAWAPDNTLMVVTYAFDVREWRVVRLAPDGTRTTVLGPVTAPTGDESPFLLIGGR